MHITVILDADGVPFVHDLAGRLDGSDELTVVVPTMRDRWVTGLKACPDLDAFLTQPGRAGTTAVSDELAAIGYSPAWDRRTDAEVAVQLVRSDLLGAGFTLSEATAAAARRRGLPFTLLPASDHRAELHVVVGVDSPRAVHVAEVVADPDAHDVREVVLVAETWTASDAARAAVSSADAVVLGPASRTFAIDPVLRSPGMLEAFADQLVLVVEHPDSAPEAVVAVAGMREPDPGRAEPVAADAAAVLDRARRVTS